MSRAFTKEYTAALRAPFVSNQTAADQQRMGLDLRQTNGWWNSAATADGLGSFPLAGSDSANLPTLGGEQLKPFIESETFHIGANGSIATTPFFLANGKKYITGITYTHKTAAAGTATAASITHEVAGQAPGAGSAVMSGTFNIKGTANVTQAATLNGEANYAGDAILVLNDGDQLSFLLGTGTITSYAGVVVTVYFWPGSSAPFATYYCHLNADIATQTFFLANCDETVVGVRVRWGTAFVAAATLDITQETTTGAPGAGTSILTATVAIDGTANTTLSPAVSGTASALYIPAGNRLSTKFSATTTGANVVVVVYFAPKYRRKEVTFQLAINAQQQVAQSFFVADRDYEVIDGSATFSVAAGGASKLNITIDKNTTAPGSGNVIFTDNTSAGFDLAATANTVQIGTLNTLRNRLLSAGDRCSTKVSGAAQSTADVCVTISLVPR